MRRRALLVSLGALSAGCVSVASPDSPTPSPDAESRIQPDETYQITRLSVTTNNDGPSVKYVLKPRRIYSAEAVEERREESDEGVVVMDLSEVEDRDVRQALVNAFEGEWRSNTLPDGLADLVDRVDFFTGIPTDGTYTHIGFELYRPDPDSPSPLEFEATVVDDRVAPESPGTLEYTLRNTGDENQNVASGWSPPFGILRANEVAGEGEFLLWRDYSELEFSDGVILAPAVEEITDLKPGGSVSRQYEVLPATTNHRPDYTIPPAPGDYRTAGSLDYYEEEGQPESEFSFEVVFTLQKSEQNG